MVKTETRKRLLLVAVAGVATVAVGLAALWALLSMKVVREPAGGQPSNSTLPLPDTENATYTVNVGKVHAGSIKTILEKVKVDGRECFRLSYSAVPSQSLNAVLATRLQGSTLIWADTGWAHSATVAEHGEEETEHTSITFAGPGGEATVRETAEGEDEVDVETIALATPLDMPAALLYLRTHPEQRAPLQALKGDDLYELQPSPKGMEWVQAQAGRFLCRRLVLEQAELDKDGEDPPEQATPLTLWFDAETGVLVCVQARLLFGQARACLQHYHAGAE